MTQPFGFFFVGWLYQVSNVATVMAATEGPLSDGKGSHVFRRTGVPVHGLFSTTLRI